MEHRHSARKQLIQRISIESPRTGPFTAITRNIGLDGMFVEANQVRLPLHTQVKLSFSLARGTSRYPFSPMAMVVRTGETGMGLMFLDMELDTLRVLGSVLSSPVMIVDSFETTPTTYTAPRHAAGNHGNFR